MAKQIDDYFVSTSGQGSNSRILVDLGSSMELEIWSMVNVVCTPATVDGIYLQKSSHNK